MFKKGLLLIIVFVFMLSICAYAYDYTFTQQSGSGFFVGIADKADALEDSNELRQIVNDLGTLLYHSKMDGSYPKDKTTGGTLAIPNSALVSFAIGTKGDLFYCSAANVWTKINIGANNQIFVVATDVPNWETASSALLSDVASIAMLDENETILGNWVNTVYPWVDNEIADDITCSNYYLKTEINTQGKMETIWDVLLVNDSDLDLYYLKTAIDTQAKMETIWGATLCTDAELTSALADYYLKVAINTQAKVETIWEVALVNDGDIDTQTKMETIWGVTLCTDSELTNALNLYYLKTAINTQTKMETIWGVSLANDSELHNELTLGSTNGLSLSVQELSLAVNSSTSAGAVSSGAGQNMQVWKTDAYGVPGWRPDEGGVEASTFILLSDTPADYAGQGNKYVRVKAAENGLEFATLAGGGDVLGPAFSVDHSIARWNGTDNKTIQDSLAFVDDAGSINIPTGQTYKINDVNLSAADVGAIQDAADIIKDTHLDFGSETNQINTDDLPEGSSNLYQLTEEEVEDYVGGMLGGTEILITVNYDDDGNAINFTVNNDLSLYSNTTSAFITKSVNNLDYYYLKTQIDTQGELETIWGVTLCTDGELSTALAGYYLKTEIDTLSELETIYVKDITDSDELASALADYYLKTAIDTQGKVETIWGVSLVNDGDLDLYYLKTAINTQAKVETIWGVTLATDTELAAYTLKSLFDAYTILYADTDNTPAALNISTSKIVGRAATGGIAALGKADVLGIINVEEGADVTDATNVTTALGSINANALADITSSGANIEDAVTKKHTAGADTTLGTLTTDINMGTHKLTGLSVPSATGQSVRTTATITEANLEDAVTKKHTQNTDTAAGGEWDFGANSAGFTIQTAGGDGTTTINWTLGNYFKFTHGAMAETFTFNPAPTNPGHLTLIIIQDGVGGRDCTWPVPMKWLGAEPTWTDGGAGKGIVIAIVYDGTSYWSQGTPWEE